MSTFWKKQIFRGPIPKPHGLTGLSNGKIPNHLITPVEGTQHGMYGPAADAYRALRAHANSDGIEVGMTGGYRSLERQETLWQQRYRKTDTPSTRPAPWLPYGLTRPKRCRGWWWGRLSSVADAACPGTSNHGWGLAFDWHSIDSRELAWAEEWAQHYGFMWENSTEAWHLTYIMGDAVPPYRRLDPPPPDIPPVKPPANVKIMFTGYVRLKGDAAVFAAFSDGTKKFLRDEATFIADKNLRLLSGAAPATLGVTELDAALFAATGLVPAESRDSLYFIDRKPRDAWGVILG